MMQADAGKTNAGAAETARARVLFLHPNDELYGSDRVLLNLLRHVDRSRFDPYVIIGDDAGREGLLTRELQASQIPTERLPIASIRRKYLSPAGLPWFARRLRHSVRVVSRLIEREHIDLVYSNTLAVWTGALAAARTGRPHIWHAHEIIDRPLPLKSFMRRFVPHSSQRVVCVSQAVYNHWLTGSRARAKGMVLYNGIDPQEWLTASGADRVRAELGCERDDLLVGMVGRISEFKAPDLFAAAAARVLARHDHVRFFIAGAPIEGQTHVLDRVERIIAAAPAPERIRMLGFRRDVPDLTAAADILVVPSRAPEPFPLVNLQAMFAGKPLVAADVGSVREAIRDGETGLVVPREDDVALAEAISALVRDGARRQAMGEAGRRRALAEFTLERQVGAFNHLLWHEYATAARPRPEPVLANEMRR